MGLCEGYKYGFHCFWIPTVKDGKQKTQHHTDVGCFFMLIVAS